MRAVIPNFRAAFVLDGTENDNFEVRSMHPGIAVRFFLAAAGTVAAASTFAAAPPRFPVGSVWHENIASAAVHPQSAQMISTLNARGGWGPVAGIDHRMHIDFSIHVYHDAPLDAPTYEVVEHKAYEDYYLPDCEPLGTRMPVPADAAFEDDGDGQPLVCDNEDNDCHLIVQQGNKLYELYSGNLADGPDAGSEPELDALCLAVWELSAVYPAQGRGEHCTSADAAGFPIAPLMPNADEVFAAAQQAGADLGHAIRFILPNDRMASDASLGGVQGRLYVRPATHAGGPSGPAESVPYGARLRLRADFPMAGYNPAAQTILRTMQRYGIVLADGGNIALTFESDRHTSHTWAELSITPQIFWSGSTGNRTPVKVTDFAVLDTGPRIAETYDCERTLVTPEEPNEDFIFGSGFEG